ncbi:MAG: transposase, partial [Thermodesulfobacteriota bacterium]
MARLARVVAPGVPHHVTQRGNRRQRTFFCDEDYKAYIALMAEWCCRCGVAIWAYC